LNHLIWVARTDVNRFAFVDLGGAAMFPMFHALGIEPNTGNKPSGFGPVPTNPVVMQGHQGAAYLVIAGNVPVAFGLGGGKPARHRQAEIGIADAVMG
jgi:hypothetical protein